MISLSKLNDRSILAVFGGEVTLSHYGQPDRKITGFVELENPFVIQPIDGMERHNQAHVLLCMREDVADLDHDWTVTFEAIEYPVLEVPTGTGLVRVLLGDPL